MLSFCKWHRATPSVPARGRGKRLPKNPENPQKVRIIIDIFRCVDLHGNRLAWYRRAVGYYRTAVGYCRVIAQKILQSKNTTQDLLKTQKIVQIGPITVENDKNEKRTIFFDRNIRFSSIFLETSDPTTIYILYRDMSILVNFKIEIDHF